MPSIILPALVVIPVLTAVAIHFVMFAGTSTPSKDFGSGQMFDMIATRYDMINRVLALRMDVGWRKFMVQQIQESLSMEGIGDPNTVILDVATGTADVALLLAEAMPNVSIVGVDPSANMLTVGQEKVNDAKKREQVKATKRTTEMQKRHAPIEGSPLITLQHGPVEDFSNIFPQPDQFAAATMSFGIRNVVDRENALCEIHRVLMPEARFCILEFSEPDSDAGVMGFFARLFIRHVVPFVGGVLSGAPKEYLHLQNSIKDFPSPREFTVIMAGLQCGDDRAGHFRVESVEQLNFGSVQLYVTTAVK